MKLGVDGLKLSDVYAVVVCGGVRGAGSGAESGPSEFVGRPAVMTLVEQWQ